MFSNLLTIIDGISDPLFIGLIVGGVAVLGLIIAIIAAAVKKRKNRGERVDKVIIKDGVRYSKDSEIYTPNGNVNITHNKGDVLLTQGKKQRVTKTGKLLPGKYTALSADQTADKFNVRIGGFVREIKHNSELVLAEGDEITAVSHSIILR